MNWIMYLKCNKKLQRYYCIHDRIKALKMCYDIIRGGCTINQFLPFFIYRIPTILINYRCSMRRHSKCLYMPFFWIYPICLIFNREYSLQSFEAISQQGGALLNVISNNTLHYQTVISSVWAIGELVCVWVWNDFNNLIGERKLYEPVKRFYRAGY